MKILLIITYAGTVRNNISGNSVQSFNTFNESGSFPSLSRNQPSTSNKNQFSQAQSLNIVNIQNILNNAAEECFGCDYATLKKSFDKFMFTYNMTEDGETKRNALFNIMVETNYA